MLNARVKVAVRLAPERGRAALHAVDFYVLTSWNVFQSHFCFCESSCPGDEDFFCTPRPLYLILKTVELVGGGFVKSACRRS